MGRCVRNKNTVDQIRGGLVSLTTQLLDTMDFPMEFTPRGSARVYQLSFDILLADEKAIKEVIAVKGVGSYKP